MSRKTERGSGMKTEKTEGLGFPREVLPWPALSADQGSRPQEAGVGDRVASQGSHRHVNREER